MATLGKNQVFEIKNGDGTSFHNLVLRKSAVESIVMSLGDKISGDVYYKDNSLSVTMHEYITYKGVNYMLVNPPTIVREGIVSDNSELKGMTKYSFVFYHPMCQLANFPFSDVAVTSDETRYLGEGKTFSWIGKPADFVAKLNKNLTGTEWIVELSSRFPQDKLDELSNVIPFDNATIADACKTFYDTWGVPYVVDKVASTEASYAAGKRFKIVMGLPSNEIYSSAQAEQQGTPFVFQMGHGVGLKNNSRTTRNNKIITRISGYGSENNIPYGYPQVRWYGTAGQAFTYGDHAGVYTDVTIDGVHLDKVISYPIYRGVLDGEYVELIKHPFTRAHLMPSVYRTCLFNKISFLDDNGEFNTDYNPDITLIDYYDAIYSSQYPYPNTINLQAPSYESHEFEDEKPELGEAHIISATPLNNDLTPASSWDDSLDDEGNYKQSYFQMVLPQLSFDLYACASITEEMQINMRSGACLGCTFTVQVDWDDYKRNFYDDDGNFAPNGSQRDLTKYPKSNQGSISLVLQKDNSTFGTLMPNMYQYPKGETSSGAGDGDTFVILGISLPESYIFAAEWRLDADMKSYMLENNVHYFDYPLKFDEDFLFHNENILSQIRPNTVVRFNYAGQTQALFVKQITVKYGDQPLPQYDITLTDNVEVVLNQIGQVAEDVEKLSTLIAILRQSYGKNVWNELAKKLSKTQDDTAAGYITMLKGLQIGANFVPDILGEGGVLRMRDDGKVEFVTDILYARVKAYFDSVEIREYQHTGGNRIASVAGNKICRVAWYNSSNVELEQTQASLASVAYFRCYFRASDGEDTVRNNWVIGDQAYCHITSVTTSSDNPEQKGLNQKHLWRLVIGRNTEGTLTEDGEAYIDLSNRATETISGNSYTGYQSGSDIPEAQDDIIQLGNVNDTTRQGAIVEFVTGTDAPSYQIYQGINSFSLNGKNQISFGYNTGTGRAYLNVYGDFRFGARPNTQGSYLEYNSQTGALNIKAHVEFTNSDQELDTLVQSHQRDDSYDDTEVRGLIDGLQDQIDGQIESWFYNYAPVAVDSQGAPTSNVPSNVEPYKSWNDADVAAGNDAQKIAHLGDTFTNNKTGYCWRFTRNSSTNAFEWTIIQDSAVITALQNAAKAQDTADHKRRVFLSQPVPPYDAGDMWVNAVYPANYTGVTDEANHNYNNDILKCVTAKASDGSFSINDWALASKYTDDSKFNGYISALLNNTGLSGDSAAAAVQNAILGALGVGTVVAGGLLLTSLIGMRQYNGSGDKTDVANYTTWAGISGQYNANVLGGGMAAWYGGGMLDKETLSPVQIEQGWNTLRWAKGVDRFDGSGYRADGNISWNANGALTIKNITTLSDSNNKNILNELATFNSAFTFGTSGQGSTTALYITPQVPFESLYIGTSNANKQEVATKNWVNQNFVTTTFFDNLFRLYNGYGNSATQINVNGTLPTDKTNLNIEAMFGFWTKKYISALGQGDDGSTSYTTLAQLNDVSLSNPTANQVLSYNGTHWVNKSIELGSQTLADLTDVVITSPAANQMLGYDATAQKWKNIAIPATGVTSVALSMPTGFSISGSPITASGTFTVAFASGYSLPTTAKQSNWDTAYGWGDHADAGYALAADLGTASSHAHSDYLTSLSWDSTNKKLAWSKGGTAQTAITIGYASVAGSVAWDNVSSTPTTLSGYGITDAKIANGVITLGANSITPVTTLYTLSVYGGTTKVLDFKPNNNASLYIKASGDISLTNDTTNKYITLSYSHPTNGADTSIAAADGRVLSAITVNSLGHVTSVSYKALAAADIPDLSSTYSTSTRVSTLEGYFTNGVAKKAAQLNTSHSLWGNSFNGTADINGNIVMNSANGTYIQIGAIRIVYDLANNALKVVKSDGTTAANFYATGGISALGMNEEESHVIGVLNDLNDVNITNAVANQILVYDGTHWRNQNQQSVYELPMATTTTLGGIMLGYAASGKNYALQLDANGKAYVNVPWSDTTYTLVGLIGSTAIGSTTQPIYWDGSAFKKTTYTLGKSVPSTAVFTDTWIAWVGATSTAAGTAGYMPAPTSAQRNQFLRGDGTWVDLNNYSLPTASAGTLGGVKVGTTLAISSGVLNLPTTGVTAGTYKRVTVDAYGRVTSGDNTDTDTWRGVYVDGVSKVGTGVNTKAINFKAGSNVSLSFAAAGTGSGQSTSDDYFNIVISATDTTYSAATQSAAGLMSAADKKKLDGVAANANNYSLPLATSGTRGGVQIGYSETNSGTSTDRNYAVQLSSEKMFVNVPWVNTWRGIQDNLTSTSTTDSLSAAQGKALKGYIDTLNGYFSNGVAKSAAKLTTVSKTAWGQTFWTSSGVPDSISGALSSVTNITMSGYIKIGDAYLSYDSTNNAIRVSANANGTGAVNFYAVGGVSALGETADGQAGVGDVTWALLADNTDTRQIARSHITTALTPYATQDWVTANFNNYSLPLAANGTRGGIQVGYTTSIANHNYAVQLSSEKAYVNIPLFVKSGSTAASGLVPAPSTTAGTTKFLREDGTWVVPDGTFSLSAATSTALGGIKIGYSGTTAKTYAVVLDSGNKAYVSVPWENTWTAWAGATSTAAGTAGYMPAPTSAQRNQFLRGDGTWVSLNNYSLPTASADTLGGVKVGTTLAIASGVLNLPTTGVTAGTYKRVTVDAYGRVTSGDNTDIDTNTWRNIYVGGTSKVGTGIDTKAINFKAGSNVAISYVAAGTGSGQSGSANYFDVVISATDTTYSAATQSAAGLMSAADKKKLDGVAANANNYSLPLATSGTRGGVKIGYSETNSGSDTTRNYAVQLSSEKMYVNVPWENTWRGIQNNLTSDSTTDSLSAAQGKALKGYIDTLNGYFSNGVAKSAAKLTTVSKTAWGQTFWTSSGVPDSISGALSSVTNITMSGYIKIGDAYLSYDSTNNAIRVSANANGTGAVNFYAVGGMSALGETADGQAGVGDVTWALLADGTDTRQIALSHLTTSLTTITGGTTDATNKRYAVYKNSSNQLFVDVPWQAGAGTVTSVKVGTTSYTPTNGVISLPAYPTVPTKVSQLTNDSGYITSYTNTWRNIYVSGTEKLTTAITTKGLNFAAGSNVSLSFTAAGSGTGQNANYGTITISATDTTYSVFTASANGLVPMASSGNKTTTETAVGNYYLCADGKFRQLPANAFLNNTYTLAGLMGSAAKGGTTQPIYWNGSAFANTTYTLGKSVPSDAVFTDHYDWSDITNKPLTLTKNATGFSISGGTTSKTLTVGADYTLGAACAKGVTDNSSNADVTSSDTNLITGRTLYYQLAKKSYTTNTGTVTSVATGTGLTGGTITTSGTISINSTYQTYISHGESAYNWGNHANAGYLLKSGGTMTGIITRNGIFAQSASGYAQLHITDSYTILGYDNPEHSIDTYVDGYVLHLRTGSSHDDKVYIGSNGYVGIGTTSPQRELHVEGTGRFSNYVDFLTVDGTARAGWVGRGSSLDNIISLHADLDALKLYGNSTLVMTLSASSNVGLASVNGNITTDNTNGRYVQIGSIRLVYDSTNNAIKVIKSDGTNANLYATGGISALGAGQESGGGGGNYLPLAGGVMSGSIKMTSATGVFGGLCKHSDISSAGNPNTLWLYNANELSIYGAGINFENGINCTSPDITFDSSNIRWLHSLGTQKLMLSYYDSSHNMLFGSAFYVSNNGATYWQSGRFDGESTSGYPLILNVAGGGVCVGTNGTKTYVLEVGGSVGANSYNNRSDIRTKNVIKDVDLRLDQIAKAPAFEYYWLDTSIDHDLHVGTSAQYWESVLPQVVTTAKDEIGTKSLQYGVTALISAITVARKVMTHEEKIALLETRVSALEKENGEQEQLINSLQEELAKFKAA